MLIAIASVLLSAAAGLCAFLLLLSRKLMLIRDSPPKTLLIGLAFLLLTGGFAVAGFLLPQWPWLWVPSAVLALVVVGELRRAGLRRAYAGSRPVSVAPHGRASNGPLTTTDLVTSRYEIALPDWPGRSFRVTHLSDLHVNPRLPADYYLRVLAAAEATQADLVFLTGDFVTKLASLPALASLLRPLGRHGTYAVLGNHDYWAGADEVRAVIRASGVTLLTNESVKVELDGGTIQVTGWDYPWAQGAREPPPLAAGALHLVLSHTPDNIYRLSRRPAHGVFSGHNHGGQLRLPRLGSVIVPSVYGRRFDHGHFVVNGAHLFVTSGVGAATPPLRLYCPPDIFVVDVAGKPR